MHWGPGLGQGLEKHNGSRSQQAGHGWMETRCEPESGDLRGWNVADGGQAEPGFTLQAPGWTRRTHLSWAGEGDLGAHSLQGPTWGSLPFGPFVSARLLL